MAAAAVQPIVVPANVEAFVDIDDLASQAEEALEAYRRAPWRQLTEATRLAKLRRAIELLHRVEDLETGRIPMPACGD